MRTESKTLSPSVCRNLLGDALTPSELDAICRQWSDRFTISPLQDHPSLGCSLKRDDLGLFSTHKARGVGLQVMLEHFRGQPGGVMSSSGNAAVALGGWCTVFGFPGMAFLSHKTPNAKVEAVARTGVTTVVTPKPKNFSRYAARYGGLVDMRPSRHPAGALGYRLLAAELTLCGDKTPSDVFVFINSALTLVGLFEGLEHLLRAGEIDRIPALHAVQNTADLRFAHTMNTPALPVDDPVAGALGAQAPVRLEAATLALQNSGGALWMVDNNSVRVAAQELSALGVRASIESAAALAGYQRAAQAMPVRTGCVLLAAPSRVSEWSESELERRIKRADSYTDVKKLVDGLAACGGPAGRTNSGLES